MKKLLFSLFLPLLLYSGVGGKIVGTVIDSETGTPLPYANIQIEELKIGTSTDEDGHFFILNVPPGEYRVKVSFLGYNPVTLLKVKVEVDRTTVLNIRLKPAPIETREIKVVAKRPLIEKDVTWKMAPIEGEELQNLPIGSGEEVITLMGGVTEGPFGELHVRGGRSDEILYIVDGFPIENPYSGEFTGYIEKNAVNELVLLSGTFAAEYGRALSGIVNVVTREGGERLEGGLEVFSATHYLYRDPKGGIKFSPRSVYRRKDWFKENGDALRDSITNESLYEVQKIKEQLNLPFRGEVRAHLGGPLPLKSTFFLAGTYKNEESYLPFGYTLVRDITGKITSRPSSSIKVEIGFEGTSKRSQSYNHKWKYNYRHYPTRRQYLKRLNLNLTHFISQRTFYRVFAGGVFESETLSVNGKYYSQYEEPKTDDCTEFFIRGDALRYRRTETRSLKGGASLVHQFKNHEIKLGASISRYNLRVHNVERLYIFGYIGDDQKETYRKTLKEGEFYIQDKMEFPGFVVNAGLRLDYFDPMARMWRDIKDPRSGLERVKPSYQISPRLGVAYPVSERALLHFAYGHFMEPPPAYALYTHPQYLNPDSLPTELGIVGNPALKPKKTVAYEVGVLVALTPSISVDFTLYAKDVWDLLTIKNIRTHPYNYNVYYNEDFASIRGLEISARGSIEDKLRFSLSYTYQVARGNRSFPTQGFYNAYMGVVEEMKEYYLDFDRRHDLSLLLNLNLPKNFSLSITGEVASGLPYTPYVGLGVVVEENSARMPYTMTLDMTLIKKFWIGSYSGAILLEVKNLLNRANVRCVYPRTGDPWDPGEWGLGLCTEDYARDPSNVGPPRRIRLGLRIGR